jgi:hypothetical protein
MISDGEVVELKSRPSRSQVGNRGTLPGQENIGRPIVVA